jgi:hypothetical protein
MAYYLTKVLDTTDDNIGIVGLLTNRSDRAWRFLSLVQRGNGRKGHPNPVAAVPKWFDGYLVCADNATAARNLTTAYRKGALWAIEAALNDRFEIRAVRRGRVDPPNRHLTKAIAAEVVDAKNGVDHEIAIIVADCADPTSTVGCDLLTVQAVDRLRGHVEKLRIHRDGFIDLRASFLPAASV